MNAIVEIAGNQYKVSKNQQIYTNLLNAEEGSNLDFDSVMVLDNDGDIEVGKPHVKGAKVSAKVVEHGKDDKILVFKKKRRKGFKKTKGHRQDYTKLLIEDISK